MVPSLHPSEQHIPSLTSLHCIYMDPLASLPGAFKDGPSNHRSRKGERTEPTLYRCRKGRGSLYWPFLLSHSSPRYFHISLLLPLSKSCPLSCLDCRDHSWSGSSDTKCPEMNSEFMSFNGHSSDSSWSTRQLQERGGEEDLGRPSYLAARVLLLRSEGCGKVPEP